MFDTDNILQPLHNSISKIVGFQVNNDFLIFLGVVLIGFIAICFSMWAVYKLSEFEQNMKKDFVDCEKEILYKGGK